MNEEQRAHSELLELLQSDSFSGVISVLHDGRERITFAGGLSNRETGRVNDLKTRFAAASVSKMFTGICIARLVDAGLCHFEQPLIEVVPRLEPHFDSSISLACLLSHRSGLGDYLDEDEELPFSNMDVERLDCPQAFLPYVLTATRGSTNKFRYSSAGFILLGLAVEAIVGKSFPKAMAQWVVEPADLVSTGFPRLDEPSEDLALGYLRDGHPNLGHLPPVGGADGGTVTNVYDLQRLFGRLRNGFLSESSLRFLCRKASQLGTNEAYGHGFNIISACGDSWYGHTGSDPGISARVSFSLRRESSVVVLCNCDMLAFQVFRYALNWLNAIEIVEQYAAPKP